MLDAEVKVSSNSGEAYVDMGYWAYLYEGKHWSRSKDEAIAAAEKAKAKKMASLRKQLAKLEKMTFTVTAMGEEA